MTPESGTEAVIDTAPAPVGASQDTQPIAPAAEAAPDWENANDADLKAVWDKNNPERDANGQFQSKAPAAENTELTDQAPVEKVEQQVAAINAPQSWSAEKKEIFATLPPAAQEYIVQRDKEATEAISRQGNELSQYEPIKSVLEQHADIFERNGMDFSDGLGRLLNAERMLENPETRVAAIAQIAQAYGVDLSQFNGQQQPQNSAEQALHQRIAELAGQLNNTTSRIEQREKAEAETQAQSMKTLIEKFSTDKSDWTDLESDILKEIVGIKASIADGLDSPMTPDQLLTKAYERAQRNNPDAWARKLETDKKADEAKRIEAAKKNADDLKRSKSVNVNSSPANGRTVSTMDDDLRDTYRRINSG